jgi:DNA-directed RNA polymerase subunit RPC12/RpoP
MKCPECGGYFFLTRGERAHDPRCPDCGARLVQVQPRRWQRQIKGVKHKEADI